MADQTSSTGALARAVRTRRAALGLRQEELAELAGCSDKFVWSLEHDKPTAQLTKVLDVLRVLGLGLAVVPGSGTVVDDSEKRR